ncbi:MAG TPA: hypothetical protein PKA33_01565 [Amaricoccus sp.]|uniref:hypothetical protein n=1 Tax=Amaricoccus sp. TaxID=1872485 RepID=UPI002CBFD6E1|nr:hypothetical protein [Amaricoccus sp.]HMR51217.1 hypothetical protein [Amaricoccus sp.]HMT98034.1 hypothetical protein [Amaricoccus sp.]
MGDGNSHFLMALGRHDGGLVIETADQQLREVVAAVLRTGKKGSVSVTLEVAPNGESGLEVSCKVTAKAPAVSFGRSFYYTDRAGDLSRKPPDYVSDSLLRHEEGAKNV